MRRTVTTLSMKNEERVRVREFGLGEKEALPELELKVAPDRVDTPRSRRESDRSRISRPSAADEEAAEERVEREERRRLASRSDLSRSRSAAR